MQITRFRYIAALVSILVLATSCSRNVGLPQPGSGQYGELVRAFYIGLAGLQTGADEIAKAKLTLATQIAPGEPASWADLGLLALRQQDFDTAYKYADQARSRMPNNSRIEELLGTIESRRGKLPEAIGHFKKAAAADTKNLKALYALAEETERQAADASDAEAEKLFVRVLEQRPDNMAALLEVARLAAKTGDSGALRNAVGKLAARSISWPDQPRQQMETLQQAAAGANVRGAAVRVMFLRNTLVRVSQYRQDLNEVKTPADLVSDPFTKFLRLPSPASEPAAADLSVRFEPGSLPNGSQNALWVGAMPFDDTGKLTIVSANENRVHIAGGEELPFPGGKNLAINRNAILGVDLNYDFLTDLVFAGANG
ncbi:MAG: hypothetical protein ABSH31_10945, partial [Bryobacteraceae bacterium]